MVQQGITKVIEIGPGAVLTGLIKRIAPDLSRSNVSTWAEV
jgi:malonyl CoA-acyl carrier protein transacylase